MLACPAQGHINPMMNVALRLIEQGCQVIFVNTEFAHKQVEHSLGEQEGSHIKFMSIPDGLGPENDRTDLGELACSMINNMPAMLEKLIEDIHLKGDHRVICVVADIGMGWGMQVAHKLGIKGALLWTTSATLFALGSNISMLIDNGIIDSEGRPVTKRTFHLTPSMPAMDTENIWWSNYHDPVMEKILFKFFVQMFQNLDLTDWWLCNTTYELEPEALSFIPKILPIGPLLNSSDNNTISKVRSFGQFYEEDLSCLSWLDQQPHRSVVYVAFGSSTLFDQNQFTEIALGLNLINKPFLWVVREDYNRSYKMVFPNEFQGSHGKIVGWAPQLKVLSHPAIACFVSHCGWNSIIEGLSNGIPFLCWPYFSDQFYDKTLICDELKVGLGFDSDENGLVSRQEIKLKVDQLLNDENIRSRSLQVKEKLVSNLAEGGRSSKNLKRFVDWLKEIGGAT
ncbi:hypothetical protein RIF29_19208 [Crotalaria pallida]|uniref:Uncharacterized protein n=1 Tax=Crotalaria pallida TaxID=3830 RepID=A0AAN9I7J1_CROPI